jgi:hypothetical protein
LVLFLTQNTRLIENHDSHFLDRNQKVKNPKK